MNCTTDCQCESTHHSTSSQDFYRDAKRSSRRLNGKSCLFQIHGRNRKTGKLSTMWTVCLCWDCRECVEQRLKPAWQNHAACVFKTAPVVYRVTCSLQEWGALYRRLHRLGAEHMRVHLSYRLVIYANRPMPGAEELTPEDAAIRAKRDIASCPVGRRGVSTSHDWAMRDKIESKYERIDCGRVSKRAIKAVAEEHGLAVKEWRPNGFSAVQEAVEVDTSGMTLEEIKALLERMKEKTAPPWLSEESRFTLREERDIPDAVCADEPELVGASP